MKKTIKLAVVAALALGTTSAFATNGDIMIGQGAKSRSMGGVGIAKSFGAESGLANPAMINSVENMEVTGAVTAFMPSVEFSSNSAANAQAQGASVPVGSKKSASDLSVIPEVEFAHRVTDNVVYGVIVAGTAGMGVDYDGVAFNTPTDNGAFNMKTALQLLKVAIPVSYTAEGFTVGFAPVLQYGTLEMSHQIQTQTGAFVKLESPNSSDIGYGFELGIAYDFKNLGVDGLTLGAVYKSEIAMTYANVISKSIQAFQADSFITSGDSLDQPEEYGVGVAYAYAGSTVAFDYKRIAYSKAAGYADFGWEDQSVFALGYEYAGSGWALRAGYNYAKNPIVEQNGAKGLTATGPQGYPGAIKNFFNLAGFPGVVESHLTIGGGFDITKALTLDAAVVYAQEVNFSYDTSGMTEAFAFQGASAQPGLTPAEAGAAGAAAAAGSASSSADVKHSQLGVTIAMSYRF